MTVHHRSDDIEVQFFGTFQNSAEGYAFDLHSIAPGYASDTENRHLFHLRGDPEIVIPALKTRFGEKNIRLVDGRVLIGQEGPRPRAEAPGKLEF